MNDFTLRIATYDDLDDIVRLENSGFSAGDRESAPIYKQRIQVFPAGSLLAKKGDRTIGCFFCEIWPPMETLHAECFALGHRINAVHDDHGTVLYVASMTVEPYHRGQGRGHSLFSRAVSRVVQARPRISSVVLLVNEVWAPAREIYRRSGFKEIMTLPDFFSPGEGVTQGGIVMRKELSELS